MANHNVVGGEAVAVAADCAIAELSARTTIYWR